MWIPLSLSSLELAESFKFVNLDLLTNVRNFQPFKYFFSASHFLSSPLTPLTYARCFGIVHQSLKSYLFIFLSFYYLLFRLDNFNDLSSRSFLFYLSYFLALKFLISLSYILSSLAETFHLSI